MPKIWVGRTTLNGEKKEDGLTKVCDIISHEFKQKIRAHELELDDFTFTLGYWLP